MITEQSNVNIKPNATLKIGDLAIIHAFTKTKVFDVLFRKQWTKFIILCLGQYLRFSRAILAFQHWSVFRFNPGFQTMGILAISASLCFLLSFNSTHVEPWAKPLAIFIVPFVPFFKTQEELYDLVIIDIESQSLLVYTGLYLLASIAHLFTIWISRGNNKITRRGVNWIGFLLSKHMKVDEFVINLFTVLISIGIGLIAWRWGNDIHFGIYMGIIAIAEASQLVLDKAYQAHTQSILSA